MLETGNTRLRLIREGDLETLAARLAEARPGPFYPAEIPSLTTLRCRFEEDGLWSEREGRLLVEDGAGLLVGWIFHFRNHPYLDSREIAYFVFDEASRNRGHATAALVLLSRYLFETLPVDRLELNIAAENAPSLRVAAKAGFLPEGRAREAWYSPALGRRLDGMRYALLRSDLGLDPRVRRYEHERGDHDPG